MVVTFEMESGLGKYQVLGMSTNDEELWVERGAKQFMTTYILGLRGDAISISTHEEIEYHEGLQANVHSIILPIRLTQVPKH